MAIVTVELRTLMRVKNFELFDFDYPVINDEWKHQFEQLFINTYMFNEIGFETPDRFKHALMVRLNTLMPYYIDLFKTRLNDVDPMIMSRVEEEYNEKAKSAGTASSSDNANNTSVDYPQHISEVLPSQTNNSSSAGNSNSSTEGERDYSKLITTYGSPALVKEYRDLIFNINEVIIKRLRDLFILVY